MVYTEPKTWTNEPLVANDLNTYVSDNLRALKNPPSKIYNINESSNYTLVAVGATAFANVDTGDTEGKFRLTIDTKGGAIFVTGMLTVSNNTANIATQFTLSVDGTIYALAGDDGICSYRPNVGANTQIPISFACGGGVSSPISERCNKIRVRCHRCDAQRT